MAIGDNGSRIQHAGNGVLDTFPFAFEIFEESDLKVYVDSDEQTLDTDYTVSGVSPTVGGDVVFTSAPANGTVVTIERQVSAERTVDYQLQGNFSSDAVNADFDRLTAKDQELSVRINRAIRLAPEDASANLVLPLADVRPLKIVGFDEDGDLYLYEAFLATAEVLAGQALKIPRVKAGEDGFELRTPAETRSDIGADNASNLASGTVANARLTANLSAIGGQTTAADKLTYWSGSGTAALADLTSAARSLLDDANASSMLSTLGALPLAGGTLTGNLTLSGDPASALQAATKQYVDSVAAGMKFKPACRVATTASITLSGEQTIDGITVVADDRVLVKSQSTFSQNGIYVCAGGAWSRATDFDAWSEFPGALVLVEVGTTNADTGWLCTVDQGGTLGSTAVVFSQFLGGSLYQPLAAKLTTLAALSSIANLTAIADQTTAADKLTYWSGAGSASLADLSGAGRALLDDADASSQRTTLGLGSIATQDAGNVTISGGSATFSGAVTLAADPDSAMKAATKQYVDSVAAGLSKRYSVRVATTANVNLTNGLENSDTIDGVTLATGDLVLVKDQSSQAENGVYVVPASGAASRDSHFDTWSEHPGTLIAVQQGTTNDDTLWLCTANTGGTLGSTAITWAAVFPGSGGTITQIVAGTGLSGGTITSTGTIALDVPSLTADTSPDPTADYLPSYDNSATAHKKVTPKAILETTNALSALSGGSVDQSNDKFFIYDNSVGGKYITVAELLGLVPAPSVPQLRKAVFTSSGTFTKGDHATITSSTQLKITVVGPGGNGGSGQPDEASGGGGGGGGTAIKWVTASSLSSGETVTVGTPGNASSFGSHCSASSGSNGANQSNGGAGGVGSSGDINLKGEGGETTRGVGQPGGGGSSFMGGGGNTMGSGGNYGGGGTGGTTGGGSSGANGIVIVEWIG